MKYLKISAAVSAAMMMSSGAFALNQADTAAAATQLVVAGASAARDTFVTEFAALCQNATLNVYRANPTANKDFRAYSCTLLNADPVPLASGLRNTNVTVYYRSEGGSGWGPGSIAKSQQIKRLLVDGGCTVGTNGSTTSFGNCQVDTYTLSNDAGTGHLVNATTDLGVSDVEAPLFRASNWVGNGLGTEPPAGALEGLTRSIGFAQVFGVAVNSGLTITNISKQDVASIYSGLYQNWNQVQDLTTGNAGPDLPITVCRRERGSGTQVGAAVYFLQQSCGKSSEAFVTETAANPGGYQVIAPDTTTLLEACINNNPGAIGPNVFKNVPITDAPNVKYLSIDGVAPGKVNAAKGTYDYWFEASFAKRPGLSGGPLAMADLLIARSRAVAGIPTSSASAFAVPGIQGNTAVLPVNATVPSTPVGLGTRSGNTCKTSLGQL